jgi:DnaK suppressor protein
MQSPQLEQLQRTIHQRLVQLEDELRSDVARSRENNFDNLSKGPVDPGDASVADLITDLTTAELTRDLGEWRSLRAAEERIRDGSYGTCCDCGRDIPFERLKAQPAASRCVDCQSTYEKTHAGPSEPTL